MTFTVVHPFYVVGGDGKVCRRDESLPYKSTAKRSTAVSRGPGMPGPYGLLFPASGVRGRLAAHNERRQFAAQTRSCGCLPHRGKHCSLPSFAALNCGPTRTTPHRVETAAVFFGSFFCCQKKEQVPGRLPFPVQPARFTQILHNIYLPVVVYLRRIHYNRRRYSVKLNKRMDV